MVSVPRGSSKATGHGQINGRKDFKKLHIIADSDSSPKTDGREAARLEVDDNGVA